MTMRKPIDLSGEEDVYASAPHDRQAKLDTGHHEIRVVSDSTPTALARIYGLLSTMSVVPLSSSSSFNNDGTINSEFHLSGVTPSTIDLLKRKINQLTETVVVADNERAGTSRPLA